jgi:ATP-dependent DNA ligase
LGTPEAWEGVLVGERIGRRLVYRGVIESGIGRATVAELLERCPVAKASPFHSPPKARQVTWLEPRVRIAVTYNELMEGRLRDPVFRGIVTKAEMRNRLPTAVTFLDTDGGFRRRHSYGCPP